MYYFDAVSFGFHLEPQEGFVEITDEEYQTLFEGQSAGYEIVIGDDGRPTLKAPDPSIEINRLAMLARMDRDGRMRTIYDAGTQMIRRELETIPLDPAYETKLIAKRTELHAYARLLQGVPDQPGFPVTIIWPDEPTEELS